MDREEAGRALELLRTVVKQARDDSALQNFGLIWVIHGFANGGGFIATNLLMRRGVVEKWPFIAMWAGIVSLNVVMLLALRKRTGAISFVERHMWSIWLAFIGAVLLTDGVNDLMGFPVLRLGPIIAVLSAVGFSSMGALMGARWYAGTGIFALTALAMALVPSWQFVILGVVWGTAQIAGGAWLMVEKRRRLAVNPSDPRLV